MKRIFALALTLIMVLTTLSGCVSSQDENSQTSSEVEVLQSQSESEAEQTESDSFESNPDDNHGSKPDDDSESKPDDNEEPLFKYNKYMVTADALDYFSDREYMLYCKMIDSILAHNGVVEGFESLDEFSAVWGFLLSEFVPARAMIQTYRVSDEPFLYENGTATLKFVGDKETCDQNYAVFEDTMNEALSLIKEDDSEWERIAKLYLYVSEHMTYGSPYKTYGVQSDLYNSIKYKIGTCGAYAYYLNMLANQIGFETIDGCSLGRDGFEGADHAWSMIRVEGEWYHFDACWQAPVFSQENMDYFAFSTQDRYNSLANNGSGDTPGELDMFNQHDHTNVRSELPYCESGMSREERRNLYFSVIGEYMQGISKEIIDDIDAFVDAAYNDVLEAVCAGANIGIYVGIEHGTLYGAIRDLILKYSPQDLENYPQLDNEFERCKEFSVILMHVDQYNLKSIMKSIIEENIVIEQTVKFVAE